MSLVRGGPKFFFVSVYERPLFVQVKSGFFNSSTLQLGQFLLSVLLFDCIHSQSFLLLFRIITLMIFSYFFDIYFTNFLCFSIYTLSFF